MMYAIKVHTEERDYWLIHAGDSESLHRDSCVNAQWGVPLDVMLFDSIREAEEYYDHWVPHPFYVRPKTISCVPLTPVYRHTLIGYKEA